MKKRYFKKIGVVFATILATSTVVSTVVACTPPKNESKTQNKQAKYTIMPTYPAQADNLIALGIAPDYYPTQMYWKRKKPFAYIDGNNKLFNNFIYEKQDFANELKNKLSSIQKEIKSYGTAWWSFSGNAFGEGVAEEYWDKHNGSFVLYDRYLIDNSHFERDNKKLIAEGGPITDNTTAYPVDFKLSRDVFLSVDKEDISNFEDDQSTPLRQGLKDGLNYKDDSKTQLNPLFNFSYFAKKIKRNFIEANKNIGYDFENSVFNHIIFNDNDVPLFYSEQDWEDENSLNHKIFKVIEKVVLTSDVKSSGLDKLNYYNKNIALLKNKSILQHHPIYEQNLRLDGGTQIYLGTMRDSLLYLYDIAFAAVSYAKTNKAKEELKDEPQKLLQLENALVNAEKIATNLVDRIKYMREFFQAIGFVDHEYNPDLKKFDNTFSKSIGLLTTSIDNGTSTLQSQSKYGFLYYDLGFKAPKPIVKTNEWEELIQEVDGDNACHTHPDGTKHCFNHNDDHDDDVSFTNSLLNMDDNGWWWNLGAGKLNQTNFAKFSSQFDIILNMDYADVDINKRSVDDKNLIQSLLKPNLKYDDRVFQQDYKLWNDGIKSPIGYNQILDAVLKVIVNLADSEKIKQNQELFNKANDWGSYWQAFVKSNNN